MERAVLAFTSAPISIRRATPDDAASIVAIWNAIVAEKTHSAVDCPFTVEGEGEYLQSLSLHEGIFLGETAKSHVVAFQSLDRWTKLFHSMDHVGQVGTFVLSEWRGRGIGRQLVAHTLAFARSVGYEKLVIYVRASNIGARNFYARVGFAPCGHFARQVKIGGEYDDEIAMEMFL